MGLLPFSLSHLMLTPRRIQLPMDVVAQSSRKRASSIPSTTPTRWSKHLSFSAKSMRSIRGTSSTPAEKAQAVDELGATDHIA